MKIHKEQRWESKTECDRIIWVGSPDLVKVLIQSDNLRKTWRGVDCKNCLWKKR